MYLSDPEAPARRLKFLLPMMIVILVAIRIHEHCAIEAKPKPMLES
jgi:hypothetical protein